MTASEFIEIIANTSWLYGPAASIPEVNLCDDEGRNILDYSDPISYVDDNELKDILEIRKAILQSLNKTGELKKLFEEIRNDKDLDRLLDTELRNQIKRIIESPSEHFEEHKRNEPITLLIKWFNDKSSKKVAYSRGLLMKRFPAQSYMHQKKILKAFLTNGISRDREWAARQLYKDWDNSFASIIKTAWEQFHERSVGITALKFLPKEYSVTQVVAFEKAGLERRYVFATLGDTEGFQYEISMDNLNLVDYLYVIVKLNIKPDEAVIKDLVLEMLASESKSHFEMNRNVGMIDNNDLVTGLTGLTMYKDFSLVIWCLQKLGMTSLLIDLFSIAKQVYKFKKIGETEYSLRLNHVIVGEERPLPLYGDVWADPYYGIESEIEDLPYGDDYEDEQDDPFGTDNPFDIGRI